MISEVSLNHQKNVASNVAISLIRKTKDLSFTGTGA
jgi:hypothetical protein